MATRGVSGASSTTTFSSCGSTSRDIATGARGSGLSDIEGSKHLMVGSNSSEGTISSDGRTQDGPTSMIPIINSLLVYRTLSSWLLFP